MVWPTLIIIYREDIIKIRININDVIIIPHEINPIRYNFKTLDNPTSKYLIFDSSVLFK